MAPPIYTYKGFWLVLLVNLLVFWVWVACKLITVFVIFLHVVIRTCTCFFFEIPPFEELQDPDSSPRREEVGRRTLRDYGGFLLPFFCRARFQLFTLLFSSVLSRSKNYHSEASKHSGNTRIDFSSRSSTRSMR